MSSRLRAFARLITVVAVVTVYVALHLTVTAGMDLRAHDRFRGAPARASAFAAALDRHADGAASARADIRDIREGAAWFERNAPSGKSRSAVSSAAGDVEKGRVVLARARVAGLAAEVGREQAGLERELTSSNVAALCWAASAGALLMVAWWLRRRRRSGAAELVDVVSRFVPRQPWWRRPVFLVASGVGCALFASGFLAASMSEQQGYKMALEAQALLLVCGLAALGAGVLILRYTRPRSARGAAQALLADGRRPVLYLRSFADDDTAAQVDDGTSVNIHSREEQLAGALGAVGPVIAVGRPGEPLPRLGAARFYLPLDDWRPTVLRLMELSQLILLRLGLGDGLWWEVEQARATQPARKLVLLVPGGLPGVAERLDEHLPTLSGLAEVSGDDPWTSAVITFGPEWTPHVHPVGPVPGTPRGVLARCRARARQAARASMTVYTPTHHVARALKTALASVGVRKRTMAWRATLATQASLWKGLTLVAALGLLSWLVSRALPLLDLR
ncbi:transferase [Streptomyces sp. NPDC048650]|uniref:transferase n=1 Tax=Streptomyces sp. NPDC048650 TaxID=3365583 RepID=UPI0037144060